MTGVCLCCSSVETILQYYCNYTILGPAIITIASIVNITYPVYWRKLLNIHWHISLTSNVWKNCTCVIVMGHYDGIDNNRNITGTQ